MFELSFLVTFLGQPGGLPIPFMPLLAQSQSHVLELTYATLDGLYVQPVGSETRRSLIEFGEETYQALAWSPDGRYLAAVEDYAAVRLFSVQGDRFSRGVTPIFESNCARPPDLTLAWAPDSERLAIRHQCAGFTSDLEPILDLHLYRPGVSDAAEALATLPETIESDLYIAPDVSAVAYVSDRHIYRLNLDGSAPQRLTQEAGDYGLAGSPLAWSPDSAKIAFYEGTYPYQRIHVMSTEGADLRLLTPDPAYEIYRSRLMWSPDSRYLAFYEPFNPPNSNQEVLKVMEISTQEILTTTGPGFYDAVTWSPDSQQLVFASGDRFIGQYLFQWDKANPEEFTLLTETPLSQIITPQWVSTEDSTGNWLALTAQPVGADIMNRQLYILEADGNNFRPLTSQEEFVIPFRWTPVSLFSGEE